jgi:hypothetical protein
MKKQSLLWTLAIILMAVTLQANGQEKAFNREKAKEALRFAAEQYSQMMQQAPYAKFPRTTNEQGELKTTGSGSWTSGFYPGICWYLYEYTGNEQFKTEAMKKSFLLEKEKFNTGTHDLGFMLYCSFGNGYRLTGNNNFKEILIRGANSLISRYDPDVGCIKSWDWSDKWEYPVIIDNMMNLEMLFWASQVTENNKFKDIAVNHADKTIAHHYRPDYSSYHVVDYNPENGKVEKRNTHQGYSDESSWARGQSWGLYGYVMSYRMTGKKRYLEQAKNIADFLLSHRNLPEDKVPYWDFDAPKIPNAKRDASAGAIMASALLELQRYVDQDLKKHYIKNAQKMLNSLSGEKYKALSGENANFVLKHSVGSLPGESEIDVPLIYADYYYIEALIRYLHIQP